jgi:hypothetical protein
MGMDEEAPTRGEIAFVAIVVAAVVAWLWLI